MIQYKTISGPRVVSVGKNGAQAAFDLFAEIMNREAANGWTYHSMETLTIVEKPGCMQQPIPTNHYMLIFYREI